MKKWDVYVYGDVNIDLIIPNVKQIPPNGEEWEIPVIQTITGGGAALFTLGLGKLGLYPVFKGAVGNDCYGHYIMDTFRKQNIDTSLLSMEKETGTGVSLSFTNEKDRSFVTYRGTNSGIDITNIRMEEVIQAKHIHVTGYAGTKNHAQYLDLLKKVKENTQTTVSFDVGWDDTGEWNPNIAELFSYIDVLFMNETESVHYSRCQSAEEAAQEFAKYCMIAVIKLGKKGSMAVSGQNVYKKEGFPIEVVDTTGAGDSFNAGFIYGFLAGMDIEDALRCGNGCGALSCTGLGGNTTFPNRKTLKEFINR